MHFFTQIFELILRKDFLQCSQGTNHSLSRYDGLEAKQKCLPFVFSELMLICTYADTVIELIVITYN
jgi:hypothetical protein